MSWRPPGRSRRQARGVRLLLRQASKREGIGGNPCSCCGGARRPSRKERERRQGEPARAPPPPELQTMLGQNHISFSIVWPWSLAPCLNGSNQKETTQGLNDCLASYLDRVRSLDTENRRLESKIQEHLEKKGLQVRDWGHYFKTMEDLRAQIFANSVNSAHIILQIDNPHLATDETGLAMCQSGERHL
ncbi:hypothetical protein H8958_018702 [Nasalis larvatus]